MTGDDEIERSVSRVQQFTSARSQLDRDGRREDDRVLAERSRDDRAAFGELYDRYVALVYGYCLRRLWTVEVAEDATSLIFANALAAIAEYRPERASFRSWLFAIAHHTVVDEIRVRARSRQRPNGGFEAVERTAADPEERVLQAEGLRELRALLRKLPADHARIVELRLSGLDMAEIGEVLGKRSGTVRVAYHRAVKRLHALMTIENEDADG